MFGKKRSLTLDAMLTSLATCGIRLRPGVTIETLFTDYLEDWSSPDELARGGFQEVLIALGGGGAKMPPSDDVYYFDAEAIVEEGDYTRIVERLCALAKGDLVFDRIADHYDENAGFVRLELQRAGKITHIDLKIDDDWADPALFSEMEKRLIATGSKRRFAYGGGEDEQFTLIVCQPPEALAAIAKVTGIRFSPE